MNAETKPNLSTTETQPHKAFEIDANALRAAMAYQAKNDVRYYLNGIFISKDGLVAATNGHTCLRVQCELDEPLAQDYIISIDGIVPKPANYAKANFIDNKTGFIQFYKYAAEKTPFKTLFFSIIDGKFPDLDKLYKDLDAPLATESIGINPQYLSQLTKIIKSRSPSVKMTFYGDNMPMLLTTASMYEFDNKVEVMIMPMKL